MGAAMVLKTILLRLRRSERLAPVRQHLPLVLVATAALSRRRGLLTRLLAAAGLAGFVRVYLKTRAAGREQTAEHLRRMRRLRRSAMQHFYITCIGSMEEEIAEYPNYDRRKHDQRYQLVANVAGRHVPHGGTVVDVGCASAIVLDRLRASCGTRGIGFDLAPYGLVVRSRRADPPVLAQAVVEHIPVQDGIADQIIFSEVIEHLLEPDAALREVSRVTRLGGTLVLTTNNASEMPEISPLRDPLTWVERLAGRWRPQLLGFRNITWPYPINDPADPLPKDTPTYVPHLHFAYVELRDLAAAAGFDLISSGSFEFPAPQSRAADWLRRLSERAPRAGALVADSIDAVAAAIPGVRYMGTHHLLVFRKSRQAPLEPQPPWWLARLPDEGSTFASPQPTAIHSG
jgi:SAM-dependent methyltransferase